MWDHLTAQISNFFPLQSQINDTIRPVRQIDDGSRQGFVEWCICVAKPSEASGSLQSVLECCTKRKTCVLASVVVINVQVALTPYPQTPTGVFSKSVNHMVKEANASIHGNFLAVGFLAGMVFFNLLAFAIEILLVEGVPKIRLLERLYLATIEVDGDLDLGLICIAIERSCAGHFGG